MLSNDTVQTSNTVQSTKQATQVWLLLLGATLLAAALSFFMVDRTFIALITILIMMLKGQLVVDYFMGLKTVGVFWRVIMSAYCVVIGAMVMLIILIS